MFFMKICYGYLIEIFGGDNIPTALISSGHKWSMCRGYIVTNLCCTYVDNLDNLSCNIIKKVGFKSCCLGMFP